MRAYQPIPDLWEGIPATPGPLGETLNHSRTFGRAYKSLPNLQGETNDSSRISGRASQPLLDLWEGLPTTVGPPEMD